MRLVRFPSWIIDRARRVVWENDAAVRLFGDMRGRLYTSLVAPDYLPLAQEQFARKLLGQPVTDYELVMRAADGSDVTVEVSSVPIPDPSSGIPLGIFGLARPEDVPGRSPPTRSPLTPRQAEALRYLAAGCSTQQVADAMGLSIETVRNHVRAILRKLGAHSRLEAVARARSRGLLG
jgi:PAS domain S-box-containing protein